MKFTYLKSTFSSDGASIISNSRIIGARISLASYITKCCPIQLRTPAENEECKTMKLLISSLPSLWFEFFGYSPILWMVVQQQEGTRLEGLFFRRVQPKNFFQESIEVAHFPDHI
eukprot:scaffold28118_cov166-Skeletonema_menzelii.AAC.2